MPNAQEEALLAGLKSLGEDIKASHEKVEAGLKDRDAEIARIGASVAALQAAKAQAKAGLPSDAPLEEEVGNAAGSTKIGWRSLPLRKALSIPSNHRILRGRGQDAEELDLINTYHDASAILFHIYKRKHDETIAWTKVRECLDFKIYTQLLVRNGYLKANEIQNPGLHTALDFTLLSATLIDKMRLPLVVSNQFDEVPLTRHKMDIPARLTDPMGIWGGGGSATHNAAGLLPPTAALDGTSYPGNLPPFASPSSYTTLTFGKVTMDVAHLLVYLIWNDDMVEDSIVPWLPMMIDSASFGGARCWDRSVVSGDETATHMDTDTTATNDMRKAIYGLRYMAKNYGIDNGSGSGGAFDITDIEELRKKMGMYGLNPPDLVLFVPIKIYYDLVKMDAVKLLVNFGQQATIKNGVLANVYGIDIVVTDTMRVDTNASGVNGASANTFSIAMLVNRRRFVTGTLGVVNIEQTRLAPILTDMIQSDVRKDFQAWDATALTSGAFSTGLTDVPAVLSYHNTN